MKIRNGVLVSINKSKDIKHGSITIPNSVTSIGEWAFFNCSKLTNITIPNSVTSIEEFAFSDCSSLTNIVIPDSVTFIGSNAFNSCSKLTSIIIPDSVRTIGYHVFSDCSSLTSVTLGNGVTRIGGSAFKDCFSLKSINIPDDIMSIGKYAFENCSSLDRLPAPRTTKKIKCVKGFYPNGDKLYCRNFDYEVGKTYKERSAKLCEKGFHACTLGLDVFNYYADREAVYYEVELSGISPERGDDSKICGKRITILRKLTVAEAANYKASLGNQAK